ncbi:MAG: LuxR C-terminal-related transcriptional regulator [Bacteroidales bacterium]|nr:LuxR C-terminal-related transcriptional regulator [Bacteroidales bacterium]
MEQKNKQRNYNEEISTLCKNLIFDPLLPNYKAELIDWHKLNNLIILPNQFILINDLDEVKNIYIHQNIEKITGYPTSFFTEIGNIFSIIHPDDRDCVFEFSNRTVAFSQDHKDDFLKDPLYFSFMIDFRICRPNGNYIRVTKNSCCYKTDHFGNIVFALILFTDITSLKSSNKICFTFLSDDDHTEYFKDLIEKYHSNIYLTRREQEILQLLAEGDSSTDIANKLFISESTVISHRKNLLEKTCTKNTAQLIKFAIENNLLRLK